MDRVQQVGRKWDWRTKRIPQLTDVYPGSGYPIPNAQSIAADRSRKKMKIMIVSVCQYNSEQTPLQFLSYHNKKKYTDRYELDLVVHEQGPLSQDNFKGLFMEPTENRPPAWSKIDGVLEAIANNHYQTMKSKAQFSLCFSLENFIIINELIGSHGAP